MKFNEFWSALCKKTSGGFEFHTLARGYPFTATYSSGKIIVKPSTTKYERPLSNNEFHKVWIKAAELSKQEAFIPNNYQDILSSTRQALEYEHFIVQITPVSMHDKNIGYLLLYADFSHFYFSLKN